MRNLHILSLLIFTAIAACGDDDGQPARPDASVGDVDAAADAPASTAITVTVANRPNAAATFGFIAAYRDGSGAWQLAPAPAGDTYQFPISSPEWSFAWTCITANAATRDVSLYHFTVAERTSLTIDVPARCTDRAPTAVALSGTITNPPPTGGLRVAFGNVAGTASVGLSRTYSLQAVAGTRDLFVGHVPTNINGDVVTDEATIQRARAVSAATTADVDFATAEATQSANVTVTLGSGETARVSTILYSAGGTFHTMVNQATGPTFTSTGLATAMAQAGDVYNQQITVSSAGAAATVQRWVAAVADQTYVAPAALGGATSTVPATMPYPMIQTTWAMYANAVGYEWTAQQALSGAVCGQGGGDCVVTWATMISPAMAGASPSVAMPDLSMLQGWDAKLQFQPGTNVTGNVRAMTSSNGASDFPVVDPATAGTQRTLLSSAWTVTP